MENLLNSHPQFVRISEVAREDSWTLLHFQDKQQPKADMSHSNHWVCWIFAENCCFQSLGECLKTVGGGGGAFQSTYTGMYLKWCPLLVGLEMSSV